MHAASTHRRTGGTGFTLIELLVVIAIIGLLSSVVLASLSTARAKAEDAARAADVKAIKTALEIYYNDHGNYPELVVGGCGFGCGMAIANLATPLVSTYLSSFPVLLNAQAGNQYVWGPGNAYGIMIYQTTGWCKTGVNVNPGWWGGSTPLCSF